MKKYTILSFVVALFLSGCATQKPSMPNSLMKQNSEINVPVDLYDSIEQLRALLDPEIIERMKARLESDPLQYHVWILHNWIVGEDSRLSKWFEDQGVKHPDVMTAIIIESFRRHLNNNPIKLEEQIKSFRNHKQVEGRIQHKNALDKK